MWEITTLQRHEQILLQTPLTFWVQAPHVLGFQGVVGADLDLELQDRVWETLKEELVDGHVEGRDDFL